MPSTHILQIEICTCGERSLAFQSTSSAAIACGSSSALRVKTVPTISDRQLAAFVAVDQVPPHALGGSVGRAGEHARVHVGRHPEGGGAIDRQTLRGADGFEGCHAEGHADRERGRAFDRRARQRPVGIALVILLARVRVGAVPVEPRRLHRRRVEPEIVRVGVKNVHRPVAGDLVEPLAARIVGAERDAHRPAVAAQRRVQRLRGDPLADRVENPVLADETAEVHAQLRDGPHGEMVVAVDEARHEHPPGEIHNPGLRASPCCGAVLVADIDDLLPAHRHCLGGRLRRVDRVDQTVLKQPVGFAVLGARRSAPGRRRFGGEG